MRRRRAGAILLGFAATALVWALASGAADAAHHCRERPCFTPRPAPVPSDPPPTRSAGVVAIPAPSTPHVSTPPPAMGPATGIETTPSGLRSVPPPAALIPAPHPAGDLTTVIILIIVGLSLTAIVAFVLAFSAT